MTSRYRTRPQVKFREFAELELRRVSMSNTIWALMAGSKLASIALDSARGSGRTLSEIFPVVEHIGRFNVRIDDAHALLAAAETDLSVMAMSQAIALHEDFVKTCLTWLLPLGKLTPGQLNNANTFNIHETMNAASGRNVRTGSLRLFHLSRLMRNCHIHAGGSGSGALQRHMEGMTRSQRLEWSALTLRPFVVINEGEYVTIGVNELVATLAIGKRLAYEVNLCLQRAVPRRMWADIAVRDYFTLDGSKPPRDPAAGKRLSSYARTNFSAIALSETTLKSALKRYIPTK